APSDKNAIPPNGDKREYFSQAPYYWPDPQRKDGKPYIHKDGKANPEISKPKKDNIYMAQFCKDVYALGLAYYHTREEKYAANAAGILRLWFLDETRSMYPRFEYGQIVVGKDKGRAMVFADTYGLIHVIDAVRLIEGSESWRQTDTNAVKKWFSRLLDWMLNSEIGKQGKAQLNNIGTYYDMQVIAYALFTGQNDIARNVIDESVKKRIDKQITQEGEQVYELKRASAWGYSVR